MTATTTTEREENGGRSVRSRVRRWGARELVTGWVLYWLGLLLYAIWPKLREVYRLAKTGEHGSVSLSLDGDFLPIALWIAGPPLLMAALWIATRPPRR